MRAPKERLLSWGETLFKIATRQIFFFLGGYKGKGKSEEKQKKNDPQRESRCNYMIVILMQLKNDAQTEFATWMMCQWDPWKYKLLWCVFDFKFI